MGRISFQVMARSFLTFPKEHEVKTWPLFYQQTLLKFLETCFCNMEIHLKPPKLEESMEMTKF